LLHKTEIHCHSRTVSACASITPREIVEKYVAAGYTTVVLMEHLNSSTFRTDKRYTGGEDWQEKIDYYMEGYHALQRAAGDKLHILWGCELCLAGTHTDYLIHGMTEKFLRENEDLLRLRKIEEVAERVHGAGMLLYQAHPFRNNMTVTDPKILDGIEIYNAHPRHNSRNDFATLWAEHYGLLPLSGSDIHDPPDLAGGGILTELPITTREELLRVLCTGEYELIREGRPGK